MTSSSVFLARSDRDVNEKGQGTLRDAYSVKLGLHSTNFVSGDISGYSWFRSRPRKGKLSIFDVIS